ncbi:MAG: ABC transporter ATP-binding protein [Limnochordia bacterium]|nr:ABC transporter ATP-binding protein [Bacillota bacterium]NLL08216.1 ABC transporter ATP-binding protein [Bacillota bacterium]HBG10155.1 ABC transporter ATP-binding protein [Bacillota bacterium]
MLKVIDLHVHYGGITALRGINLTIKENQIVTLIGANGAGKSSTLRAIMGLVKKSQGQVLYKGEDISSRPTKDIVSKGITMVPEGRRVFANLTVEENLLLGAYTRTDQKEIARDMEAVYNTFPRLRERSWQKAGTLSGGEQQMLAVGRALMSSPQILMMDEPSLGLAPLLVKEVFEIILLLRERGNTILLVEQNAKKALEIADYGYVLETGRLVLEGPGKALLEDTKVQEAYLGAAR